MTSLWNVAVLVWIVGAVMLWVYRQRFVAWLNGADLFAVREFREQMRALGDPKEIR